MKRLVSLVFLFMLLGIFAACSSSSTQPAESDAEVEQAETGDAEETDQTESEGTKDIDFPTKPVTIIVPHDAGGGTDATARALASAAEKHLGESIGVVNKPGGGGAIGMSEGANSNPDGHTITMITVELNTLHHLGLAPITYEDFAPVAQINFDPGAVTVPVDAPYDTLEEFLEYAKEHPGEIRVGNSGPGSIWHLASASIEKATGVQFSHVPFDGANPAVTALLGGHIEAVSVSPAEVLQYVKAGELKTLAVLADERVDVMPDVPTMKELGFGDVSIGPWRGLAVPKDTPKEIVEYLSDVFLKAAEEPEFVEFMESNGLGIVLKDADEFAQYLAEDDKHFAEIVAGLDLSH